MHTEANKSGSEVPFLKEKKPDHRIVGDYAASGGYYISCAADWIVAEPTTLTGSIGIFGMIPDPSKLLTETLDLHFDGVKTNRPCRYGCDGQTIKWRRTGSISKYGQ